MLSDNGPDCATVLCPRGLYITTKVTTIQKLQKRVPYNSSVIGIHRMEETANKKIVSAAKNITHDRVIHESTGTQVLNSRCVCMRQVSAAIKNKRHQRICRVPKFSGPGIDTVKKSGLNF